MAEMTQETMIEEWSAQGKSDDEILRLLEKAGRKRKKGKFLKGLDFDLSGMFEGVPEMAGGALVALPSGVMFATGRQWAAVPTVLGLGLFAFGWYKRNKKFEPSTESDLGGMQDWWEGKEGAIPDFVPFIGTREKAAETQAAAGVPEEERVKPYEKPEPEYPDYGPPMPPAEQPKPEKQPFYKQTWFVPTVVIGVGVIGTASILWAGRSK
jgi:hypothetical protein